MRDHRSFQNSSLVANLSAPAILVALPNIALGNTLPAIVTAYVAALATKRVMLVQSSQLEFFDFGMPLDWQQYAQQYAGAKRCKIDATSFGHDMVHNLHLCGNESTHVLEYFTYDYDLPLLQVNPAYQEFFAKYLPGSEVFHTVAQRLLKPHPQVLHAMEPYLAKADKCDLGIHVRSKKWVPQPAEQYAKISTAVMADKEPRSVFLAADDAAYYQSLPALLPKGWDVWWSNITISTISTVVNPMGNPGSLISAAVDYFLLMKCKNIIVTGTSSFGCVAAAHAGVVPVYSLHGTANFQAQTMTRHDAYVNPFFWKSLTSEPCMYKGIRMYMNSSSDAAKLFANHPLYYFHIQCCNP